ncbi:hypothetical protein PPACK8108_LOCUS7231 [Phakopsora pachyrhizi]|uniref:Uncharacterized protein n=1 Tax=Phakopsora pachyrhizi TaxID=170000 RepID=A0AAV0AVZ6_PHAPC|nr:hypothetical protein PPACK8108_LOCUS7231 [Phakopsora pachyrhizi]
MLEGCRQGFLGDRGEFDCSSTQKKRNRKNLKMIHKERVLKSLIRFFLMIMKISITTTLGISLANEVRSVASVDGHESSSSSLGIVRSVTNSSSLPPIHGFGSKSLTLRSGLLLGGWAFLILCWTIFIVISAFDSNFNQKASSLVTGSPKPRKQSSLHLMSFRNININLSESEIARAAAAAERSGLNSSVGNGLSGSGNQIESPRNN